MSALLQKCVRPFKRLLPRGTRNRRLLFGPAAGCVMPIDLHSRLRTYLGVYEFELNRHFRRMVKRGANCFDIGGRDGYDALMIASLSRGRVVSFECDAAGAESMRRVFAANPALSIQVVEAFVGLELGPGYTTIDRAAEQLFVPDFIKMDIEGAEDAALEGAAKTLATRRPHLIIEVHGTDKEENCISILRGQGYRIAIVDQSQLWKDSARGTGHNRWLAAYGSD